MVGVNNVACVRRSWFGFCWFIVYLFGLTVWGFWLLVSLAFVGC